jgi:hypothetical protein
VQDAGETGINGVTVQLLDDGGTAIASAVTVSDGNYKFDGLPAGTYMVNIVTSTLPSGLSASYDLDGVSSANKATFTLAAGADRTDVDFGYKAVSTFSIGDRVWKDIDGDGVQDSGETGISGVTIQLLNSSGTVIATTTTNSSGNYTFSGLSSGTYKVKVTSGLPTGYAPTYDLDGIATANIATVTLTASRTDVDFGYRSCKAEFVYDTFTTRSFSNNEGSVNWSASWIESDTAGAGVNSGNVTVGTPVDGYMILRDSPDTGTQPSAARQVDLSAFPFASVTVNFHIRGAETDDKAIIEVSKDGGSTYTVLDTLTNISGTLIDSRTYNISTYKASNTRIRFRIASGYGGSDDFFKIDEVRVDGLCAQ